MARYGKYLFFRDAETAKSYFSDWVEMAKGTPPPTVVEIQFVEFSTSLEEFKHWFPKPEKWAVIHPETGDEKDPLDQWTKKCKGQLNSDIHRPSSYGSNEYRDVRRWISGVAAWEIFVPSDSERDPSKYQSFLVDETESPQSSEIKLMHHLPFGAQMTEKLFRMTQEGPPGLGEDDSVVSIREPQSSSVSGETCWTLSWIPRSRAEPSRVFDVDGVSFYIPVDVEPLLCGQVFDWDASSGMVSHVA
jgi:hypothetical protein